MLGATILFLTMLHEILFCIVNPLSSLTGAGIPCSTLFWIVCVLWFFFWIYFGDITTRRRKVFHFVMVGQRVNLGPFWQGRNPHVFGYGCTKRNRLCITFYFDWISTFDNLVSIINHLKEAQALITITGV